MRHAQQDRDSDPDQNREIGPEDYPPSKAEIIERRRDRLPKIDLFPITAFARDWTGARRIFFADNGMQRSVLLKSPVISFDPGALSAL